MKRIGFFGGCFNPPNTLHIEIANNLIKEGKLDKVVFVPVNNYYKKQGLIDEKHRYNMLKLAIKDYKNLEVDDIEIKESRILYAVDAFEIIKNSSFINRDDKDEVYFIMGSDNFIKMPMWKDYNKIKDKYKYIIIDRNKNDITSTKIREMIYRDDEDVKEFLNKDVYEYIVSNQLYKL
ncbi:MAG: nicotinate-nicotinamide nucleotide adenylyltransferase [Clostridia bacterium]|nr:nicotinate-nicotinamide nucleotide adenylyltransferase [Clostridia bacterium]